MKPKHKFKRKSKRKFKHEGVWHHDIVCHAKLVKAKSHLKTVKVCSSCGKGIPKDQHGRTCPYCDGSIITKVLVERD